MPLSLSADGRAFVLSRRARLARSRRDVRRSGDHPAAGSRDATEHVQRASQLEFSNGFQPRRASIWRTPSCRTTARITIDAQDRDPLQQRLTVTYDVASSQTRRAGAMAASLRRSVIIIGRRRRRRLGAPERWALGAGRWALGDQR